jgi:hypothetical protein
MASSSVAICDESPLLQRIGLTVIKNLYWSVHFFYLLHNFKNNYEIK